MKINNNHFKIFLRIAVLALFVLVVGSLTYEGEAADPTWTAQYWNNASLSGNPVLTRQESTLDYDWGTGSPAPEVVERDNFSAFWKRVVYFPGGTYRFTATMDDGMRVWIDDVMIIDSWTDSQVHSISRDVPLTTGDHEIEVRYYERGGQAVARLTWTAVGGGPAPISNWQGAYYNNTSLTGSPALVRDDAAINFDWGVGSPAPGVIGADDFSVRWTRTLGLESGRYRFTVTADDGVRLWVNGQLVVDQWHDALEGTYAAEVDISGGSAAVQMDYYENTGGAVARLEWLRIGGSGAATWRGEYFNNPTLSGSPVLVRDDGGVSFNWGTGSPSPGTVNADNFSVRWTSSVFFNNGRYRFSVTSDDGVRVWVNNQQIINGWSDHPATTFTGEIDVSGGSVPVRVEYYESTGSALINLSWVQIGAAPSPPTPPTIPPSSNATGVVQSPRLNVRYGPGLQYGVITQLVQGQIVPLTGFRSADGNWVMINWDGEMAWVSGLQAYLATSVPVSSLTVWNGSVPGTGGPMEGQTARVAFCNYLNVRSGPGVGNPVITVIPADTIVTLLGRNSSSSWVQIRLVNNTVGWVSANYLIESVPLSSLPVTG